MLQVWQVIVPPVGHEQAHYDGIGPDERGNSPAEEDGRQREPADEPIAISRVCDRAIQAELQARWLASQWQWAWEHGRCRDRHRRKGQRHPDEGGGGAEGKGGKGHGRAGPCRTCATHDRKRCTGEKHKYRKMGNSTNGLTLAQLHLLGFVPVAAAAMANVWT